MKRRLAANLVPLAGAALCLALVAATTLWAALPLNAPMRSEFGWPGAVAVAAGACSLLVSGLCLRAATRLSSIAGIRFAATAGSLASGAVVILVLPNLTHLWQLWLAWLALGVTRATVAAAVFRQARAVWRGTAAMLFTTVAVLLGAAIIPWVAMAVMRTSWREGTAECGGILILLATPIAYVLLPGMEKVTAGADRSGAEAATRGDDPTDGSEPVWPERIAKSQPASGTNARDS